jgi:ABC-type multidrug transport system fused ATPase/permease subunit
MLLAIFTLCAYLSLIGQLSIGNVIVIVTFATMLNEQIVLSTVKSFLDAQSRLIKIEKLKELLSRDDESEWKGNEDLKVREGKIEFRNVSFSYDDNRKTLDGLSFTIEAGSHFALVGKSGCGKTTIANLLIGLYEIQSGDILIDGNSLYNYNLRSIRQSIGVVQQDIMLFDGSIRSNLLLGDFSATEEELWLACEKAGISEFIDTLEKKLDTLIGPGGIMLSGGQKQRIEIARIYLKNPAIILFDEATSALDSATEKAIHEAWREVLEERTAIVISHRESSVLLCDSVLMIENGKAHIAGVPGELLRQDIGFRALFAMAEGS